MFGNVPGARAPEPLLSGSVAGLGGDVVDEVKCHRRQIDSSRLPRCRSDAPLVIRAQEGHQLGEFCGALLEARRTSKSTRPPLTISASNHFPDRPRRPIDSPRPCRRSDVSVSLVHSSTSGQPLTVAGGFADAHCLPDAVREPREGPTARGAFARMALGGSPEEVVRITILVRASVTWVAVCSRCGHVNPAGTKFILSAGHLGWRLRDFRLDPPKDAARFASPPGEQTALLSALAGFVLPDVLPN